MNTLRVPKPLVLIILDGWGISVDTHGNAISKAKTPYLDWFKNEYPSTTLRSFGEAVGLPRGMAGDSEVGHSNLGAGFIVKQHVTRINETIKDGSFFRKTAFLEAIKHVQSHQGRLHIMTLLSDDIVHSSSRHLYALMDLMTRESTPFYLHLFTDGRDSPPKSALNELQPLLSRLKLDGIGQVATIMGRYYGMDRDKRWERTQVAYEALVNAKGRQSGNAYEAVEAAYQRHETDEFIPPTVIVDANKKPIAKICDNDAVIFCNYREDRARQLTEAFVQPDFKGFSRTALHHLKVVTFTEYEYGLPVQVAYQPVYISYPLAQVVSSHGLRQLHVAETEKYAHVTYFFNGRREDPFEGEERVLIPSLKIESYALKPEMGAFAIRDAVLKSITQGVYDFMVVNFANPDMVGHTGDMAATIKAVEVVDQCVGRICQLLMSMGGAAMITSDHGNAECLLMHDDTPDTEHDPNPVPFIYVDDELHQPIKLREGVLADVAPTILSVLNLPKPAEMTGRVLLSDRV